MTARERSFKRIPEVEAIEARSIWCAAGAAIGAGEFRKTWPTRFQPRIRAMARMHYESMLSLKNKGFCNVAKDCHRNHAAVIAISCVCLATKGRRLDNAGTRAGNNILRKRLAAAGMCPLVSLAIPYFYVGESRFRAFDSARIRASKVENRRVHCPHINRRAIRNKLKISN